MGITLESNGGKFVLPATLDLREVCIEDRFEPIALAGRRGLWIDREQIRPRSYELLLSGVLTGDDSIGVEARLRNLMEVIQSPPVRIIDEELNRRTQAWPREIAYRRVGGHPWRMLSVSVRLWAADGVSEALTTRETTGTIGTLTNPPVIQHLSLLYDGTYPVGPVLEARLSPGTVWTPTLEIRAGNLIENGAFRRGYSLPEGWTPVGGARLQVGEGVFSDRVAQATAGQEWQQEVPINGETTYTLSAWLRSPDGGTPLLEIDWKDAGGTVISTSTVVPSVGTVWSRQSLTAESPTVAVRALVRIGSQSGTIQADGVQMEPLGVPTDFTEVVVLRIGRDQPLEAASGAAAWWLDLDRGLAQLEDASGFLADDLATVSGDWWELRPSRSGWNYLLTTLPDAGTVQLRVLYRERHL
ncbi:MAG: hypothetical protein KatS3mg115_1388 [Candidatus Poribacteria bacterium]|nr:MAG: hypothetical protein KatS3mg115_1388 [Candidatus Poribacteria bacterium]